MVSLVAAPAAACISVVLVFILYHRGVQARPSLPVTPPEMKKRMPSRSSTLHLTNVGLHHARSTGVRDYGFRALIAVVTGSTAEAQARLLVDISTVRAATAASRVYAEWAVACYDRRASLWAETIERSNGSIALVANITDPPRAKGAHLARVIKMAWAARGMSDVVWTPDADISFDRQAVREFFQRYACTFRSGPPYVAAPVLFQKLPPSLTTLSASKAASAFGKQWPVNFEVWRRGELRHALALRMDYARAIAFQPYTPALFQPADCREMYLFRPLVQGPGRRLCPRRCPHS